MTDKIKCPKCGSDQITSQKKGFSGKKAVAGAVLTGGVGLLAGTIGSNKIKIHCLNCGNSWMPGQQTQAVPTQLTKNQKRAYLFLAGVIVFIILLFVLS